MLFCLHLLMKYPKVWAFCLNFRYITCRLQQSFLEFRNFTVVIIFRDVDKGIKRFRDLLRAVESRFTQGLRLVGHSFNIIRANK